MTRNSKIVPNWNHLRDSRFSLQIREDDIEIMEDDLEIMEDDLGIMEDDLESMEDDQKCLEGQIKNLLGPALYRSCTSSKLFHVPK
jgi:hypothetical protein